MSDRETTFKDDIDATLEAITSKTSQGRDVVVLAHSFRDMVGHSALQGLCRSKGAEGVYVDKTGGVLGLVLIASGIT